MRVIQPTDHGCYGAVAAMAAGQTFEQMAATIGHDGSDHAYSDYEVFKYLAGFGIVPDGCLTFGYNHDAAESSATTATTETAEYIFVPAAVAQRLRDLAADHDTTVDVVIAALLPSVPDIPPVSVPRSAACSNGLSGAIIAASGLVSLQSRVYLNTPAILSVLRERDSYNAHAVYWDGSKVIDPSPHITESWTLKDYVVARWRPVRNILYQKKESPI